MYLEDIDEYVYDEYPDHEFETDRAVVWSAENTEVILDKFGFYARCTRCPWVTEEHAPSRHTARQWAIGHENS